MIGNKYFATGIEVKYGYAGNGQNGWSASVKFYDQGFADDNASEGRVSTEGILSTRYYVPNENGSSGLEAAIKALLIDMAKIYVYINPNQEFVIYFTQGEHGEADEIPSEEIETLRSLSEKLGLKTIGLKEV